MGVCEEGVEIGIGNSNYDFEGYGKSRGSSFRRVDATPVWVSAAKRLMTKVVMFVATTVNSDQIVV